MHISTFYHRPHINYQLIYVLSIIFALHNSLTIFINSTYMERFVPAEVVGTFFMIGSTIAVLGFLFISRVLRKVGNVALTLGLAITEIIVLVVLGLTSIPGLAIIAFIIFLIVNPLIFLNLDIFSETIIGDDEESTGFKRGLVLTLISAAAMIGPLAISPIAGPDDANLQYVYFASAAVFTVFVLIVVSRLGQFKDPPYHEVRIFDAISAFWVDTNIRFALGAQLMLQICYAWLGIYIPLYMATVISLSWTEIGVAMAVGTLAFILFEFPAGYVADRFIGETEMMAAGFLIMGLSMISMSFTTSTAIWTWVLIMFILRVGASLVEATTESYFFKHTKGDDTNYLSFFRLSRPLGIVFGSIIGSASLLFLSFQYIFLVLGIILFSGIYFAYRLVDTK